MTYRWAPFGIHNPFIRELKSHKDNTLIFDGYFYVDAKDLPVQRIMSTYSEPVEDEEGNKHYSHISSSQIEIYDKISGEDTSFLKDMGEPKVSPSTQTLDNQTENTDVDDDFDDYDICFFPTEVTTLKYRVIKADLNELEYKMVDSYIKEQAKLKEDLKLQEILKKTEIED